MDRNKLISFFVGRTLWRQVRGFGCAVVFAGVALGQFPSFNGAKARPCGTTGAIQFDGSSGFDCDSTNFLYIKTPLTDPAAPPTLTVNGTPGATTWEYYYIAVNLVGHTNDSPTGTTAVGNATLDAMNNISVGTAAVTGSTACRVYRVTAGGTPASTGFIGSVACGATLLDNGLAATVSYFAAGNNSDGLSIGKNLRLQDQGDAEWQSYWGTGILSFNPVATGDIPSSKYVFAHQGSDLNVFNLIDVVKESDGFGGVAVQVTNYNSGTGRPFGLFTIVGNSGSGLLPTAIGQNSRIATGSTGNITDGINFHVTDGIGYLGATGQPVNHYGFSTDDLTFGTTLNIGFNSSVAAGTGKWGFYSTGSAPTKLAETVFGSLLAYANAAEVYCTDCTVTSGIDNTCAGTGSGATALRINGAWKCFI